MNIDYYNHRVTRWEPVLEYWCFDVDYERDNTRVSLVIKDIEAL